MHENRGGKALGFRKRKPPMQLCPWINWSPAIYKQVNTMLITKLSFIKPHCIADSWHSFWEFISWNLYTNVARLFSDLNNFKLIDKRPTVLWCSVPCNGNWCYKMLIYPINLFYKTASSHCNQIKQFNVPCTEH